MQKTTLDGKTEPKKVTWNESTEGDKLVLSTAAPGGAGLVRLHVAAQSRDVFEETILALARAGNPNPIGKLRHEQPEAFNRYMASQTGQVRPGAY